MITIENTEEIKGSLKSEDVLSGAIDSKETILKGKINQSTAYFKGEDGKSPYIGENGNWFVFDDETREWKDTGVNAVDGTVDLSNYYTKEETYNKEEIDDILKDIDIDIPEIDLSNYYTKGETYNKKEIDDKLKDIDIEIPEMDLSGKEDIRNKVRQVEEKDLDSLSEDQYLSAAASASLVRGLREAIDEKSDLSKEDIEELLKQDFQNINEKIDKKANSATTLEGYGITDAYTKKTIDLKLEDILICERYPYGPGQAIRNVGDLWWDYKEKTLWICNDKAEDIGTWEIVVAPIDLSNYATKENLIELNNALNQSLNKIETNLQQNYFNKQDINDFYYTKNEIDSKIGSVYKYCGSVNNLDELSNISTKTIGDTYNVVKGGEINNLSIQPNWTYTTTTVNGINYIRVYENEVDITNIIPKNKFTLMPYLINFYKLTEYGWELEYGIPPSFEGYFYTINISCKNGDNVAWTGFEWDVLSGIVDLNNYYTKTQTDKEINDLSSSVDDRFNNTNARIDGINISGKQDKSNMINGDIYIGMSPDDWKGSYPSTPTMMRYVQQYTEEKIKNFYTKIEIDNMIGDISTVLNTIIDLQSQY